MYDTNPIEAPPATPARPANRGSGLRRGIAVLTLSIGLLAVGGTAVVMAADPSASPSASATTDDGTSGTNGTTDNGTAQGSGRAGHNCPNEDSTDSGSGATDDGSSASPDATQGS